jgi:N6-L-threonylcarbamoyladenine synthase
VTSLLVGVEVARTITLAWGKPLVAVNHLEGHTYANLLPANARGRRPNGEGRGFVFPLLVLIVSGGHTELVLMRRHLTYRLVGATRDDAAGECFDKCARLLGLPYPGGPVLARLGRRGRPDAIPFPRPMQRDGTLDMSFAGLKTAVAVYLARHSGADRADVAASVEAAIVDVLVSKTLDAVTRYRPRAVALAGGVAANRSLRQTLRHSLAAQFPDVAVLEPALAYATDNAAMVAAAGAVRYLRGEAPGSPLVRVDPHLPLR